MRNIQSLEHLKPIKSSMNTHPFQRGQIFYGKVIYIAPDGQALIQLGGRKLTAKVEAPLDVRNDYWFQVIKEKEPLQLKLIGSDPLNIPGFLSGKSPSKFDLHLIQALKEWDLPFQQDWLVKISQWMVTTGDVEKTFEIVKLMVERDLPFTDEVFHSLYTYYKGQSLSKALEGLFSQLEENGSVHTKLYQTLGLLNGKHWNTVNWANGREVAANLKFILSILGWAPLHSRKVAEGKTRNAVNLTKLLQEYVLNTEENKQRKNALQLWHRLLGPTVLSQEENGLFQWTMEIPIPLAKKTLDLTIQWRGKRNEKSNIDENFSTIVLLLEMPNIGKTVIHMNVQQRVVSLLVRSDYNQIENIGKPFLDELKKKLNEVNYQLSTVRFEKLEKQREQTSNPYSSLLPIKRVDVKI